MMRLPVRYGLSDLDRQAPNTIVKCFLFCKLQDSLDIGMLSEALQQGLNNAIKNFPFMAGDIHVERSGKPYIALVPGTQVKLGVKQYTREKHKSFTDLARNSFHPDDLDLAMLLPTWPIGHQPVCGLQLNVIEGGLILACAAHHFAVDWNSMNRFLSAICQSSKSYFCGYCLPQYPACLDREPYNGQLPLEDISEQDLLDRCPEYQVVNTVVVNPCSTAEVLSDYKMRLYQISEAEIEAIKGQCNALEGVEYVSSFDCISAALWRSITRARLAISPNKGSEQSILVHTMDVRSRDPEHISSPEYFGNAAILTHAGPLAVQSLLDDQAMSVAASSIRRNINGVTISSIKDLTRLIRSLPPHEKLKYKADIEDMDFLVNSWYSGRAGDYDFGAGLPEAFRPKPNPLKGAFCVILPNFSGPLKRTYDLLIQLHEEVHDMLMEDDFFSKNFKPLSYPELCENSEVFGSSSWADEVELLLCLQDLFAED